MAHKISRSKFLKRKSRAGEGGACDGRRGNANHVGGRRVFNFIPRSSILSTRKKNLTKGGKIQ